MKTTKDRNLGALLVESMAQAVAIDEGRLKPARVRRRTLRESIVSPPPQLASEEIRHLREGLGLSQPVFAQTLNVSVGTVRSWEQGLRSPDGPSRRLLELTQRHPRMILETVRKIGGRRASAEGVR